MKALFVTVDAGGNLPPERGVGLTASDRPVDDVDGGAALAEHDLTQLARAGPGLTRSCWSCTVWTSCDRRVLASASGKVSLMVTSRTTSWVPAQELVGSAQRMFPVCPRLNRPGCGQTSRPCGPASTGI